MTKLVMTKLSVIEDDDARSIGARLAHRRLEQDTRAEQREELQRPFSATLAECLALHKEWREMLHEGQLPLQRFHQSVPRRSPVGFSRLPRRDGTNSD